MKPLFTIKGKGQENGGSDNKDFEVELGKGAVTILVAIITILPPLLNYGMDRWLKPAEQKASIELEKSKLDLERDKATASLYQNALASPDSVQRTQMLQFLISAGLVNVNEADIDAMLNEPVPQWPSPDVTSP
jgi:hypothetical protein